jgi:hypothetical protein
MRKRPVLRSSLPVRATLEFACGGYFRRWSMALKLSYHFRILVVRFSPRGFVLKPCYNPLDYVMNTPMNWLVALHDCDMYLEWVLHVIALYSGTIIKVQGVQGVIRTTFVFGTCPLKWCPSSRKSTGWTLWSFISWKNSTVENNNIYEHISSDIKLSIVRMHGGPSILTPQHTATRTERDKPYSFIIGFRDAACAFLAVRLLPLKAPTFQPDAAALAFHVTCWAAWDTLIIKRSTIPKKIARAPLRLNGAWFYLQKFY